ncbi:lysophospholipase [Jatrophihabitans telluris]|uniref:Lysophospholipase n=1 Tax=Jatrophihabitans telluris TaxID=2038343 RepID=A0ABY4QVX5_9ACTN|nr:lysophospholipase [Jatrophihabitans telluris]UQX87135.1 lysophospholipase [Jatrophihabitans telluris]
MPTTYRRVATRFVPSVALLATLATAACAADTSTPLTGRQKAVQSRSDSVAMKNCAAQCTGDIDGAKYTIKLPQKWNGTLLLYSHGYRFAAPAPPTFSAVETNAQVTSTDSDGSGSDELSQKLLSEGYALAGSSYKSNGWAVGDGVSAGEQLHDKFVSLVGKPNRTYVWGDSLGGLITQIIAEKNPAWVDGAAPMCGAVAGPNYNFDVALDVAFAVKALVDPQLKLTGYSSAEDAAANWTHAEKAVVKAASDISGGGTAKVLFIAALVNAPTATGTYDGHDVTSQVKARVEALLTALAFGTSGRYELEQRVGGDPSQNTDANYPARIDAAENQLISTVGGSVTKLESALASLPRVSADTAARTAIEKLGDTTGQLSAPTVTLHTEADPLVLVQNESVLAARTRVAGRSGQLVQLFIAPPATFSESTGAPYGAGHCNFSMGQRLGLISVLDNWVRRSAYPVQSGLVSAIGDGYAPVFAPGPWPGDEKG